MDTPSKGTIGASLAPHGEGIGNGPPLRLVVLADFGGEHPSNGPPTSVDRDSFRQVLRAFCPKRTLQVEDHLSGRTDPLTVELGFSELKDFGPAAITEQLPVLRRVRDVLVALEGESDPQKITVALAVVEDLDAFCRAISPAPKTSDTSAAAKDPPGTGGGQDQAVGRILDMVDAQDNDGELRSAAAAAVGQFISKISGSASQAKGSPSSTTRAAETLFSRQLDAVLHHPEIRRIESAWRGLKFLVDRTDFRAGVQLQIVDARRETLGAAFERAVYRPEVEGTGDAPPSLVLLDFQLCNTPDDLQLLETLGPQAEEIQAPVLFSVGASFFGQQEEGRLPFIDTLLEQPEYTKWNALRDKSWARWIATAYNGFTLRLPHAEEKPPRYRESAPAAWGSPIWAVASLVTGSFARVGWPTEVTGIEGGRVDDLPLPPGRHHPLETLLSQELANDLTAAGFIPLFAPAQSDAAFVFRAPTLHRAPRGGRLTSSLPYQLLASRLAVAILGQKGQIAGMSEPDIKRTLERYVSELLANTGQGAAATISVSENSDQPGRLTVMLELRMGKAILGGTRVELGFYV